MLILRHVLFICVHVTPQFDTDYIIGSLAENHPLYHPNGSRIFARHPLNDRRQAATVEMYKKMFLEHGVIKDGRSGKPMCVPSSLDRTSWTLLQMGAATFVEALYECAEQYPDHEHVVQLLGPN